MRNLTWNHCRSATRTSAYDAPAVRAASIAPVANTRKSSDAMGSGNHASGGRDDVSTSPGNVLACRARAPNVALATASDVVARKSRRVEEDMINETKDATVWP